MADHESNCGCGHHHEDENYEVQLVTLIDEDGNEQEFEVIDIFEVEGKEYVAIALPEDAEEVARLIVAALTAKDDAEQLKSISKEVRVLTIKHPLYDEND